MTPVNLTGRQSLCSRIAAPLAPRRAEETEIMGYSEEQRVGIINRPQKQRETHRETSPATPTPRNKAQLAERIYKLKQTKTSDNCRTGGSLPGPGRQRIHTKGREDEKSLSQSPELLPQIEPRRHQKPEHVQPQRQGPGSRHQSH
ncbi:hypothetical protein NDU88_007815 [Pleurodeles waltl]|uniref:Uncharacterized protein n=1 Tax=Pleurodeles waltl TaxID=8319 RepID=A0AAV7N6Y8_PLEWA|nr:hypothetical protein NDU88_007815 [Pleurodeles waltl]